MEEVRKIITAIKNKQYKPVYFLMGEEAYYIDNIADYISDHVLTEEEKGFNQMVLYGRDVSIQDIMGHARRFPLMADHQVIIIKEAQDLIKTIDQFDAYFEHIQPSTILVFCYKYKTLDKRKKLYKSLEKHGVLFESKKLREYQVEQWIHQFLKSRKFTAEPKASAMLLEFIGFDLHRIANEIKKLQLILPEGTHITPDHIETHIGISKEFNNFELIKAVAEKNATTAYKIGHYFAQNSKNNPLVLTFSLLYNYFSKLLQLHGIKYGRGTVGGKEIARELKISEYAIKDLETGTKNYPMKKVSQNIEILRDFDMKSKGVNATQMSHQDIMNEMLAKLFY